jgi:hypothetical protein
LTRAAGECLDHGANSAAQQLQQIAAATAASLGLVRQLDRKLAYKAGHLPNAGQRPRD